MRKELEKFFRAEMKANEGHKTKFPLIDHKYWKEYIYLKRYKQFPKSGGLYDQPNKFVKYVDIVMSTESAVHSNRPKPKTPKAPRKR